MSLVSLAVLAVVALTLVALGLLLWPVGEDAMGAEEGMGVAPAVDEGEEGRPPPPPNPGGSTSEPA